MGAFAEGHGFCARAAHDQRCGGRAAAVAPMIEAGLVVPPLLFPGAGRKTWREACDREVAMVRNAVGVVDVSTLGKIDIQGPDAGGRFSISSTRTCSRP